MRRIISILLILLGVLLLSMSIHQFTKQNVQTKNSLEEAKELISENKEEPIHKNKQIQHSFKPNDGDVIGIIQIPKLDKSLPIIEGTAEEMLEKGVGHYSSTVFPGDNEQILLSGHRDTVFRKFGELEAGDRFIVEMPYGSFEYEFRHSEIVGANDTTVIGKKGEEVLTLSTCYPFSYIGSAPDRYIIYAYPVENS